MPFKSRKQQRYLFANEPDIAKEFAKDMSPKDFKKLPEKAPKPKPEAKPKPKAKKPKSKGK